MKKNKRVIVTLAFLVIAVIIFVGVAVYSYEQERKECFQRLVGYTGQISKQIRTEVEEDRQYLVRFSNHLSSHNLEDTEAIADELSIREKFGMLSRLELLLPGDKLLTDDGKIKSAKGDFTFDKLKNKSNYISNRTTDSENKKNQIIRHCVPIKKDGKVIAILSGVINLQDMPEFFQIHDYGDNYNVFVLEADTGNYIQDTWHDTLSSVKEQGNRKVKSGYSMKKFDKAVANKKTASVVFMSKSAGEYFYMYAAPVGVEDWMVMVNVLEPVVFAQARELISIYGIAAILLLIVFGIYFIWILKDVHRDNREKEKQIRNVSYMLAVEKLLFDAHIYQDHFKQALQCVAEYLSAEKAFLWLTDDDWAVDRRYWCSNDDEAMNDTKDNFKRMYPNVYNVLAKTGGISSYGKKAILREFSEEGQKLIDRHIRSIMMIPVYDAKGAIIFVLGAYNIHNYWNDLEPLKQVALSFSMTINHYEAFYALQTMGTVDVMTGLLNRNSYNEMVDAMQKNRPDSLGCIYIDVNGLHEINNYLGHQAGDAMLQSVAELLKRYFPQDMIYRIGGDEFVVFCQNITQENMNESLSKVKSDLKDSKYELSIGTAWVSDNYKVNKVIETAEEKMRKNKRFFYNNGGKERSLRQLNEQLERMISEKEQAEAFISLLAPEFKGVYFVDLDTDKFNYLFIPDYFEEIVERVGGGFQKAILEYAHQYVKEEYIDKFKQITNFDWLKNQLDNDTFESFSYGRTDGSFINLQIAKFNEDENHKYKTQWIFKILV